MNDSNFTMETMRADDHTARRGRFLALGFATATLTVGACGVIDNDSAGRNVAFREPTGSDPEEPSTGETNIEETTTGEPTTGGTTTGEPTAGGTTTGEPTAGEPSSSEGSGSAYGNCGWHVEKYYSCSGIPGQSDPDGFDPIDCPGTLPALGEACGAIGGAGCCTHTGTVYYCDSEDKIGIEECGS